MRRARNSTSRSSSSTNSPPRAIAQRVLVYWAAVTLGPLIFAVSLTATSYALSVSHGLVGAMPRGLAIAVATAEFLLEGASVALLFRYVPNTFVRWRHALLGGLFVAVCIAAGKRALTAYFGAVPTYSMVYGAFASLPIFLVWIYLSWVIVLLGAVIAAYAPLVGKRLARWPNAPGSDFHLALVVIEKLLAARDDGRRGLEADDIAEAIGIDPLQVDPVLDALVELDWAGRLEEAKTARYVLLCDPATTPAEPLIAKLLLDPAPDLARAWKRAGFDTVRLAELLRGRAPGALAA